MDVNSKDLIPEHFNSAEAACEFWDTHSAADYWDEMEEADIEFNLQEQVFLVPVTHRIYYQIKQKAKGQGRPIAEIVNDLLERELA